MKATLKRMARPCKHTASSARCLRMQTHRAPVAPSSAPQVSGQEAGFRWARREQRQQKEPSESLFTALPSHPQVPRQTPTSRNGAQKLNF